MDCKFANKTKCFYRTLPQEYDKLDFGIENYFLAISSVMNFALPTVLALQVW